MSWTVAGDWLAVAGLALFTFGTGAQAVNSLAEFKDLRRVASKEAWQAVIKSSLVLVPTGGGTVVPVLRPPAAKWWHRLTPGWLRSMLRKARRKISGLFTWPGRLKNLRNEGGDVAVQLARYLRTARVWAVLMVASVLPLAAAVIQLVLAYQSHTPPAGTP
jgi:hypothetical protein